MKVGSGSGTKGAGAAKGGASVGKVGKSSFAGMVSSVSSAEDSTEKARKVRSLLLDELSGLANELKDGKATKEEATRKFVHLVIKEKMMGAGSKNQKAMEESVADMCESDPTFVTKLHNELLKLAKS